MILQALHSNFLLCGYFSHGVTEGLLFMRCITLMCDLIIIINKWTLKKTNQHFFLETSRRFVGSSRRRRDTSARLTPRLLRRKARVRVHRKGHCAPRRSRSEDTVQTGAELLLWIQEHRLLANCKQMLFFPFDTLHNGIDTNMVLMSEQLSTKHISTSAFFFALETLAQ